MEELTPLAVEKKIEPIATLDFIGPSPKGSAVAEGLSVLEEGPEGRPFRWGLGPGTTLGLELADDQELVLRLGLVNPFPGQSISIEHNGRVAASFDNLPEGQWEKDVVLKGRKKNRITIAYGKWNHQTEMFPGDRRGLAAMFSRLQLTGKRGRKIRTAREAVIFPHLGSPGENEKLARAQHEQGRTRLSALPPVVTLALTTRCNNKTPCVICDRNTRPPEADHDVGKQVYEAALPFIRTARLLLLHCGGEPMLSPYFDRVIKALKPPTRVAFATNAMLMTKRRADLMLERDIMSGFTVSLDAATPETYRIMRPSCDFETVTSNVAYYLRRAAELDRSNATVTLNMTLCRTNLHDLPQIVLLAERLGAQRVSFNPMNSGLTHVVTTSDNRVWDYRKESVFEDPEEHDRLMARTWEMAVERNIGMSCHGRPFIGPRAGEYREIEREMVIVPFSADGKSQWQSPHQAKYGSSPFPCVKPWQEISIEPTGDVRACYYHDTIKYFVGGLYESDALSIWNGPRMVEVRERFLKHGAAPACIEASACQHCAPLPGGGPSAADRADPGEG